MRLGFDDDLVTGVNGCYAGVALDDAFGDCHFRGFVVGAVAFANCSFAAFAVFRVVSQPLADLCGIGLQAGEALDFFGSQVRLNAVLVCFAMPFEHGLGRRFKFVCLSFKIGTGAALGFGGVARQFYAVDGEHFAPDQALLVADEEYLGENAGNIVAQGRNKSSYRSEVWSAVAGEGDENDVFAAGTFDVAAADYALAVGKQDDLEEHGRWICRRPRFVIVEAGIKTREIKFVVEQVIQCMFEGARKKLPLQINRNKSRAGVDVFVARHSLPLNITSNFDLDIWFGSRHDAGMNRLFLQPR